MFFEQKDVNFAAYADDNTPYFCDKNLEVLLSKLQISALKLLEWFSNNYIKMNSDKCRLILMMKIRKWRGGVINNAQVKKFLGVHIDYKSKFDAHIETGGKIASCSCLSYKVHTYKTSTNINEKFYNVAIQLLSTHLDVS